MGRSDVTPLPKPSKSRSHLTVIFQVRPTFTSSPPGVFPPNLSVLPGNRTSSSAFPNNFFFRLRNFHLFSTQMARHYFFIIFSHFLSPLHLPSSPGLLHVWLSGFWTLPVPCDSLAACLPAFHPRTRPPPSFNFFCSPPSFFLNLLCKTELNFKYLATGEGPFPRLFSLLNFPLRLSVFPFYFEYSSRLQRWTHSATRN